MEMIISHIGFVDLLYLTRLLKSCVLVEKKIFEISLNVLAA